MSFRGYLAALFVVFGVFSLLVTAGLVSVGLSVAQASHSSGNKWPGNERPLQIALIDATSSILDPDCNCSWQGEVTRAIADWNLSTAIHLNEQVSATCDSAFLQTLIKQKFKGIILCDDFNLLGWYSAYQEQDLNGHNFQVVFIHFNQAFAYPTKQIACHELGHALGLDAPIYGTVPSSCLTEGPSAETPSAHDYEELALIYN